MKPEQLVVDMPVCQLSTQNMLVYAIELAKVIMFIKWCVSNTDCPSLLTCFLCSYQAQKPTMKNNKNQIHSVLMIVSGNRQKNLQKYLRYVRQSEIDIFLTIFLAKNRLHIRPSTPFPVIQHLHYTMPYQLYKLSAKSGRLGLINQSILISMTH